MSNVSAPRLGFIGLGALGLALAEKIDEKHGLAAVWNRSAERLQLLKNDRVRKARSLEDLCAHCDLVFCCVSDDQALTDIAKTICSIPRTPRVFTSLASCSPGTVSTVAETFAKSDIDFLNAPVLGKPDIVRAGKASYLFSGNSALRADILEIFATLGGIVHDLGDDASTSAALKLAMNFLIASMIASFSEAFSQLRAANIDPAQLLKVVKNSPLGSPAATIFGEQIQQQVFTPAEFNLTLAKKDMQYFGALSEENTNVFLHTAIIAHMEKTLASHNTPLDWAGLAAHLVTCHQD